MRLVQCIAFGLAAAAAVAYSFDKPKGGSILTALSLTAWFAVSAFQLT